MRLVWGLSFFWALGIAWHLALACFALAYAFLAFPLSAMVPSVGVLTAAFTTVFYPQIRRIAVSPRQILRSSLLSAAALLVFFDFKNGGWVSTGGADGGNHWTIYWSILSGNRWDYAGFTAFHWGIHWWRSLFPGITGITAVAVTLLFSAWLTLSFLAQAWIRGRHFVGYLSWIGAVVSLRVLVGEGYFSQAFSWPILSLLWWSVSSIGAGQLPTLRQILMWALLLGSLRGIYGGDLPLLLTALGIWIVSLSAAPRTLRAVGLTFVLAGCSGGILLANLMKEGGGFLRYGTQEALAILTLSAIFSKRAAHAFWRIHLAVSAIFFVGVFLFVGSMQYYFVKTLLWSVLVGLAGWGHFLDGLRGRLRIGASVGWTLAWALVFQRYLVLSALWFLTSLYPTSALPGPDEERWLRERIHARACTSYLYLTMDWARSNWTNHVVSGNFEMSANMETYLQLLATLPSSVAPQCVFIEREADFHSGKHRIGKDWTCFGEICAAPQK